MSNGKTDAALKAGAESKINAPPPHDDLTKSLFARFKDLDTDKDGFVSKSEMERALGDSSFKDNDGAMVATLWTTFSDFEDFSNDEIGIENDGITLADGTEYDRTREKAKKTEGEKKAIDQIQATFQFAQQKIKDNAAKTVFKGQPDMSSIRQGLIGDCWLLAALIGVVARDPAEVRTFITSKDPAGPFDVKFSGESKTLNVPMPTDTEIALFCQSNGIWMTILELAFAAHVFGDKFKSVRSSAIEELDTGRAAGAAIPLLTGHTDDSDFLAVTREATTKDKLTKAFGNKKIVVAGVRKNMPLAGDRRDNGMPMGHAYAILGFDATKDEIKVRNPWGNPDRPVGIPVENLFTLTLKQFHENFSVVAYEE